MSTIPAAPSKPAVAARQVPADRAEAAGARWEWWPAAAIVLVVGYGPLLWLFFRQQWEKPHYQYFPFVIGAFAWLLWQRYQQSAPKVAGSWSPPVWIDRVLVAVAAAALAFGVVVRSPWLAMVSLIVLVASVFVAVGRTRNVTNLWGIWVLLWLMVPAPLNFDQRMTQFMQRVSSKLSSYVLDWFGTEHLMEGNTLSLASKELFVDEACSGIISMLSIVACAVIYAVYKNRTPLHVCLLAAAGVAWAAIFNVARISVIAMAFDRWGLDWSSGSPHELLGLVLFAFTFVALLSTDQVLQVVLSPALPSWREEHGREMGTGRWLASAWDWLVTLGRPGQEFAAGAAPELKRPSGLRVRLVPRALLVAFLPVALLQGAILAYAIRYEPHRQPTVQRALEIASADLPATIHGLAKVDFEAVQRSRDSINGMYSRTFTYRDEDGMVLTLSFDFPFPGFWHELTECYVAAGWEPLVRHVQTGPEGEAWDYVEAEFSKPGGQTGMVLFSEFDQFGTEFKAQRDWLREQGTYWNSRMLYLQARHVFQVQVWVSAIGQITEQQRDAARALFLSARELLKQKILESPGATGVVARESTSKET